MTRSVVTIRDVAREAGVAVSTVSRALNGSAPASEVIRERVRAAADRLGYQPSATAQGLRRSRTMTIGVVVPDLANPVFLQWLRGAENLLQGYRYSLLICDGQDSWERIAAHLARLYEHRVDGLLLAGPVPFASLRPFFQAGTPVEPDPRLIPRGTTSRATMEGAATLAAYRLLIEAGHRRVAFVARAVGGNRRMPQLYNVRVERLNAVLREVGVVPTPDFLVRADAQGLPAAVARLAARPDAPTAYVAGTHLLVAPLIGAIYDAGLRIPGDVSLLSFGDSDWAVAHRPRLSVIRHNYYAEARQFAERLVNRIKTGGPPQELSAEPSEFVARESIGPVQRAVASGG